MSVFSWACVTSWRYPKKYRCVKNQWEYNVEGSYGICHTDKQWCREATHSDTFVYCPPIFKNWWGKYSFLIFHLSSFPHQKCNSGLKAIGRHLDRSIDSHGQPWLAVTSIFREPFSVEECVHVFELPGVLGGSFVYPGNDTKPSYRRRHIKFICLTILSCIFGNVARSTV